MIPQINICIEKYSKLVKNESDVLTKIKLFLDCIDKDNSFDNRTELYKIWEKIVNYEENMLASHNLELLKTSFERLKRNANSVVMVVQEQHVHEIQGSDFVRIQSVPLSERKISFIHRICPESKYANQPSAYAEGTGFFIKRNVIATAAHVVIKLGYDIRKYRFISGLIKWCDDDFKNEFIIRKHNVWKPRMHEAKLSVKKYELFTKGSDWALIDVEPAFLAEETFDYPKETVIFNKNRLPLKGEKVYAFGHGLALSLKGSYDGEIIKLNPKCGYFECSLTLLGGNSGSPIFYADDHSLAGIYMRGVKKLECKFPNKMKDNGMETKNRYLKIKNESTKFEGQECQILTSVFKALE